MKKSNIPDKPLLRIREVSKRLSCDEEDVIDYIRFEMLKASIYIKYDQATLYEYVKGFDDSVPHSIELDGYYNIPGRIAADIYYKGDNDPLLVKRWEEGDNEIEFDSGITFRRSDLLVTIKDLEVFLGNVQPAPSGNSDRLDSRLRNTWAQIVKALCKECDVPIGNPFKAAQVIQEIAARHGVNVPKKEDTIATRIKELPED